MYVNTWFWELYSFIFTWVIGNLISMIRIFEAFNCHRDIMTVACTHNKDFIYWYTDKEINSFWVSVQIWLFTDKVTRCFPRVKSAGNDGLHNDAVVRSRFYCNMWFLHWVTQSAPVSFGIVRRYHIYGAWYVGQTLLNIQRVTKSVFCHIPEYLQSVCLRQEMFLVFFIMLCIVHSLQQNCHLTPMAGDVTSLACWFWWRHIITSWAFTKSEKYSTYHIIQYAHHKAPCRLHTFTLNSKCS